MPQSLRERVMAATGRAPLTPPIPPTPPTTDMGLHPTVATRHNNPLNVKYGEATKHWLDQGEAELGEESTDRGRFLKFKSPESGWRAAGELLTGPVYSGLTVDQALRKWSNNGYGAEIADIQPNRKISQLDPDEQQLLIGAMAKREGFGADQPDQPMDTGGGLRSRVMAAAKGYQSGGSIDTFAPTPPHEPGADYSAGQLAKLDFSNAVLSGAESLGIPITPDPVGNVTGTVTNVVKSMYEMGKQVLADANDPRFLHLPYGMETGLRNVKAALVDPAGEYLEGLMSGDHQKIASGGGKLIAVLGSLKGAAKEMGPGVTTSEAVRAVRQGVSRTRPALSSLTDALRPSDINFYQKAPVALSELKEAGLGAKPTFEQVYEGLEKRSRFNEAQYQKILSPQRTVDISIERPKLIQAQRDAIPVGLSPAEVSRLEKYIEARTPKTLTIGSVDELRSKMAALSKQYKVKTSRGLAIDASRAAIDEALGDAARNVGYDALDKYGLGGTESARELGRRKGALIQMADALEGSRNRMISERQSALSTKTQKARQAIAHPAKTFAEGLPQTSEELLQEALKNWKEKPTPVSTKLRQPGPSTLSGEQLELMPSAGPGMLSGPYTSLPPVQQEFLIELKRRGLWKEGQPIPKSGEQLSLMRGMAPKVMGLEQGTTPADVVASQMMRKGKIGTRGASRIARQTAPPPTPPPKP